MIATSKIVLNTAAKAKNKNDEYPVCVRVTFNRVPRQYSTGKYLSKEQFEKVFSGNPRKENKELKIYFNRVEEKANEVIGFLGESFTFQKFKDRFKGKGSKSDFKGVYSAFEEKISLLRENEQIKTAITYECALSALKKYKEQLRWSEVDVKFLRAFEKYFVGLGEGNSLTTVGIYYRNLRAIMNEAARLGVITKDDVPFGKGKYVIPKGRKIKKALTKEQIKLISSYESNNLAEMEARDFWMLSFYCNGMNIADISHLRYENIIDNKVIVFVRKKTKNSSEEEEIIKVPLLAPTLDIIYRRSNGNGKGFVFDIIEESDSAERRVEKIELKVSYINTYIDRICKNVGIDLKVTTYHARHSYATIMKRSGVSVEYISESLGHTSIKTTKDYLDSFQDDQLLEVQKNLLD